MAVCLSVFLSVRTKYQFASLVSGLWISAPQAKLRQRRFRAAGFRAAGISPSLLRRRHVTLYIAGCIFAAVWCWPGAVLQCKHAVGASAWKHTRTPRPARACTFLMQSWQEVLCRVVLVLFSGGPSRERFWHQPLHCCGKHSTCCSDAVCGATGARWMFERETGRNKISM